MPRRSALLCLLLTFGVVATTTTASAAPTAPASVPPAVGEAPDPAPGQDGTRLVATGDEAELRAAAAQVGAEVEVVEGLGVVVTDGDLDKVADALVDAGADSVDFDVPVTTAETDPLWDTWWGGQHLEVDTLFDAGQTGAGITIAVVDTGVNPDVELDGRLLAGFDTIVDSTDTSDPHGHGTSSALVAAAAYGNGSGASGTCPSCLVMPIRALGPTGSGYMSDVAQGIVWATDHGADIISMSLSGPATSTMLTEAIDYATERGVVLVAAAGNDGVTTMHYPAADPDVISVGASDSATVLYSWSNRGTWVDVAAPGCNRTGGAWFCGTSSATPALAGVVALYLEALGGAEVVPATVEEHVKAAGALHPVAEVTSGRPTAPELLSLIPAVSEPPTLTYPDPRANPLVGYFADRTPDGELLPAGSDQVLFYGAGGVPDAWWVGSVEGDAFEDGPAINVVGTYEPLLGDFNGDGFDDIFWYGPGSAPDVLWWSNGDLTFRPVARGVGGVYTPLVGDFDDDGFDDIFWYGPGAAYDSVWYGSGSGHFSTISTRVLGVYTPVDGDFDGDGRGDIFWWSKTGGDALWFGTVSRPTFWGKSVSFNGDFLPVVGNFAGGAGDDIFWYGYGLPDTLWTSTDAGRGFTESDVMVGSGYKPFAADADGDGYDELVLWEAEVSLHQVIYGSPSGLGWPH